MRIQRVITEIDGTQTIDDIELPTASSAVSDDDSSTVVLSLDRSTADQISHGQMTVADAMSQSLLKFGGDINVIQQMGQSITNSHVQSTRSQS